MADILARVLGALCSELAPSAVAVGPGDQRLEDAVSSLLNGGDVRLDLVEEPGEIAVDVTLIVVPMGNSAPWADVPHAVTLYVGENALALGGRIVADTAALLDDYTDVRIAALERRLKEQASELTSMRARLVAPPAALDPAGLVLETDHVANEREAAAETRFKAGYDADALASALGWEGGDISGPLPVDRRPPGDPAAKLIVSAGESTRELLRTSWSVLERAEECVALEITLGEVPSGDVRRTAAEIATLGPHIRVIEPGDTTDGTEPRDDGTTTRLAAGDLVPAGWPAEPDFPTSIAFVLPGAPPGGSGGSHSVVQEVLGLKELGINTKLVVPSTARARIEATYPEAIPALAYHSDEAALDEIVGSTEVVVATEHSSVAEVVATTRRTGALPAYYVQDYEAFFAPEASERGDAAVLSYRSDPELQLFAKTHWLANLVTALHGVRVELVTPSIDRVIYHRGDRPPAGTGETVRICAMVRPHTPRRRPVATMRLLATLRAHFGEAVEIVTFGCAREDFTKLAKESAPEWTHYGILSRGDVADLLRGSDVFVDLSVYQAFGRTGCEAMAAGAVPVLPQDGGVAQYATDGVDALLVDGGDGDAVLAAVAGLVRDRERLQALSKAGERSVAAFSIENAARSWATGLGAALAAR